MGAKAKAISALPPALPGALWEGELRQTSALGNPLPALKIHSSTETSHKVTLSHLDELQEGSGGPA